MSQSIATTEFVKQRVLELGFFACGIAPADYLEEEAPRFDLWLKQGYNAGMEYMANNREKRLDPRELMQGARSVIVMLYNYFPAEVHDSNAEYRISAYAYGLDYHDVIREKLNQLSAEITEKFPGTQIRGFVDSAPVLERAWASRAGLGWIGKNSMLISRKKGSYFFIAELITDLELEYDKPFGGDYCGDCSRCMDACPTGAITDIRVVDANKCISYLTIENKSEIPESFRNSYSQWIFGCDVCQQVCPWNRYAFPNKEPGFQPSPELVSMQQDDWEKLEEEQFRKLFRKSPVKRAKFAGLKRNIRFLQDGSLNI